MKLSHVHVSVVDNGEGLSLLISCRTTGSVAKDPTTGLVSESARKKKQKEIKHLLESLGQPDLTEQQKVEEEYHDD